MSKSVTQGRIVSAWLEDMDMPFRGGMADIVGYELQNQIENVCESRNDAGHLQNPPDEYDPEEVSHVVSEELKESALAFDKAAFDALRTAMPLAMKRHEEETDEEYEARLYDAVYDCWTDYGGRTVYWSAIGAGPSLDDQWGQYGSRYDEKYDFDVSVLDKKVDKIIGQSAHAFEAAIYNAASTAVDQAYGTEEEEKDVQRGPEHDTIVYRYAGNNSSIAGASAKGMYVAELAVGHLKDESRELGHCIGNRTHGHPQLLEQGITRVFSIRTEAGKTKFTIEQFIKDGEHPQLGNITAGSITEVKGKANRFPGYEPYANEMTKPDEVKLVTEFLTKYLGMTPAQVESSPDIRAGVMALKAMGMDPFSPPPKKAERPKRDPRQLQAAASLAMADYARVAAQEVSAARKVPRKYVAGLGKNKAAKRKAEIRKRAQEHHEDPKAYRPFKTDIDKRTGKPIETKSSKYTEAYKKKFGASAEGQKLIASILSAKASERLTKALKKKSEDSGISVRLLHQVYNRGLAAWRTGHRPGASQHAWAMARVNSFITKGKTWYTADADIAKKVK